MADDSCGPPKPAGAAPSQPGSHTVMCVKFGRKMEGLDRVPWKGEIGQRIYDNVSKEAWKTVDRTFQDDHERIPAESARSAVAKDHGRADGAVFLWRRRQAPRRLHSAASQRLGPASVLFRAADPNVRLGPTPLAQPVGSRPTPGAPRAVCGAIVKRSARCAPRSAASAASGVAPREKMKPR